MSNIKEGIILKVQPYKESSRLLQVFTKSGKLTVLVNGAQKINSSDRILAQYLTHISFEVTNESKTFITLKKGKIINEFSKIKNDFAKTKIASLMLEIISKTYIDDEYNSRVFDLLAESLNYKDVNVSSLSFALKLLYFLGYGMDLKPKNKNVKGTNIKVGGLVYDESNLEVDLNLDETLELLKITFSKTEDLKDFNIEYIKVIKTFIYNYYLDKLDIKLKALE